MFDGDTNEYELTCNCSSNHDMPPEIHTASCLAMSDTCLLLINNGNDRLHFFNLALSPSVTRDISWPSDDYGSIRDICWSRHTNSFFVLGDDAVCSYCPTTDQLSVHLRCPCLNIPFWSLTVLNDKSYVLSRHDTLYRFSLPSWTRVDSLSRTDLIDICKQDQYIELIRAHVFIERIAILVRLKHHRKWRIDLFNENMEKLYSGEPIRMTAEYPTVTLRPHHDQGQWTLMNENFIWRTNEIGQFIKRHVRKRQSTLKQTNMSYHNEIKMSNQ